MIADIRIDIAMMENFLFYSNFNFEIGKENSCKNSDDMQDAWVL